MGCFFNPNVLILFSSSIGSKAMRYEKRNAAISLVLLACCSVWTAGLAYEVQVKSSSNDFPFIRMSPDGRLIYESFSDRGDRVPDFSFCGYQGGGAAIPDVPVRITLNPDPASADDRPRIQDAIDQLAALPLNADGFRGTLLLTRGEYRLGAAPSQWSGVHYSLIVPASGIVLRGGGRGADGTVLRAVAKHDGRLIITTTDPQSYPFLRAASAALSDDTAVRVTDVYLPVNFDRFSVENVSGLSVGDEIYICRNTNMEWIKAIGADQLRRRATAEQALAEPEDLTSLGGKKYTKDEKGLWWLNFPWEPGPREAYRRIITALNGTRITVDIPVPESVSSAYGGAFIFKNSRRMIENIGFENLRMISDWEADERGVDTRQHFSGGIQLADVKNSWVRDVDGFNLFGNLVHITSTAFFTTVQDCYLSGQPAESMASDLTGYYGGGAFAVDGQMSLVQRCFAEHVRHFGFVVGAFAAGPNVIMDSDGRNSSGCAETHQRWSPGVLWDRMGHRAPTNVGIFDRMGMGSGHGWTTVNSVLWNCVGRVLQVESPPIGKNFCVGGLGLDGTGVKPAVESSRKKDAGSYYSEGQLVSPRSLYLQQLADRLGMDAVRNVAEEWQMIGRCVTPQIAFNDDDHIVTLFGLEPDTTVRYTLDGSDPLPESPEYTAPLSFPSGNVTVKASAFKEGLFPSAPAVVEISHDPFITARGEWLSKDATYTATRGKIRPELLNGEDGDAAVTFYNGANITDPTITITLKEPITIQGLLITARQHPAWLEVTRTITVWVSADGSRWEQVWQAPEPAYKWKILLTEPKRARYLKIGLVGENIQLCLKNVKIYGKN